MTRKDYELIARNIRSALPQEPYAPEDYPYLDMAKTIASDIAEDLLADNPRFNRDLFLKACGF